MNKYRVSFTGTYSVSVSVVARDEEEAKELAEELAYVTQYCGNGGCEQLIGVDGYDEGNPTIEPYDDCDFENIDLEEEDVEPDEEE